MNGLRENIADLGPASRRAVVVGLALLILFFAWQARGLVQTNRAALISSRAVINGSLPADPKSLVNDLPAAALWLGDLALREGDYAAAEAFLAMLTSPGDKHYQRISAHLLSLEGNAEEAIRIWSDIGDFHSLQDFGSRSIKDGFPAEGLAAYQALYQLKPRIYGLVYARALMDTEQAVQAEIILEELLQEGLNDQDRSRTYAFLGEISADRGNWTVAGEAYQQAVNADPGNIQAQIGFAWAGYELRGNLDQAEAIFKLVAEKDPDSGLGEFNLGLLYLRDDSSSQALDYFDCALTKDPRNLWWNLIRARTAAEGQDLLRAINYYDGITKTFPADYRAFFEVSDLYLRNGEIENAISAINLALERLPAPDFWVYVRAGEIYEQAGFNIEALEYYQQALLLRPDNELALRRVNRLTNLE